MRSEALTGVNVGLLGTGAIAATHARALAVLSSGFYSIFDPDRKRAEDFAERYGARRVAACEDDLLADSSLQAVIIASPTYAHPDQAEAALRAGRHVLCEIPIAVDLTTAKSLSRLAQRSGLVLAVAHTQRFWESLSIAKQIIDSEGAPVLQVMGRHLLLRRNHAEVGAKPPDDLLWHHGGHVVDTALQLVHGDAARVLVAAGVRQPIGSPLDIALSLETGGGALISVQLSYSSRLAVNDYVIVCENGTYLLTRESFASTSGRTFYERDSEASRLVATQAQLSDFLRACAHAEHRPLTAVASLLPTLKVLDIANRQLSDPRSACDRADAAGS